MSLWLFRTKQTPSFQIPGGHSPRCFNSCLWDTLVNPRGCTGVRGSTFFWDGGWDLLSSSLLLPHGSEQLPRKASQHREGLCWPVPRRRVAGAQSCPLPFPLTSQVSCRKQEETAGCRPGAGIRGRQDEGSRYHPSHTSALPQGAALSLGTAPELLQCRRAGMGAAGWESQEGFQRGIIPSPSLPSRRLPLQTHVCSEQPSPGTGPFSLLPPLPSPGAERF